MAGAAMSKRAWTHARLREVRNLSFALVKRRRGWSKSSFVHPSALIAKGVRAEEYVFIARGCSLCPGTSIGRYTMFAPGASVVGDDHLWDNPRVPIQFSGRPAQRETRIGRDVWIGQGAIISRGLTIGDGAIIGAGSVVTSNVPAREIWAGVPARLLRRRFENEEFDRAHHLMTQGPLSAPVFAASQEKLWGARE